jgi:hypothetical protein
MAQEAKALGNARDMPTWAGAQEGKGFQYVKDLGTRLVRSESRISFGTSSIAIAFAKPLDWKGSVVVVLMPTA